MKNIDTATKRLLSDPAKRWGWIIFQLHLKGISLADLAREHNVSRQRMYVAQNTPSPRVEGIIAVALDTPAATIFPDRYDSDGLPLRRRGLWRTQKRYQDKSNARANSRNVRSGAGA